MKKRSKKTNLAVAAILGGLIWATSLPAVQGKFLHDGIDVVIVGLLLFFAEVLITQLLCMVTNTGKKLSATVRHSNKNDYNHIKTPHSS